MRFKVGELAIVAVDISGSGLEGSVVEILEVGPFRKKNIDGEVKTYDYVTTSPIPIWSQALCWDYELRKIEPPAEPVSLIREEETQA